MPSLDNQMLHYTIQVGIEEGCNVHSAVFTTQLGGLFGFVMPLITGGHVVVVWRSGREFSALCAIINLHSEFPSHVGHPMSTMEVGGIIMSVVYVPYSDMLLLLPPHLIVKMPEPTIAYDHHYVVDVSPSGLPDFTIHCRILPIDGVTIHGVTFKSSPVIQTNVASQLHGGKMFMPNVWQYTPRGVQISGVMSPPTSIMWGMDMAPGRECQ